VLRRLNKILLYGVLNLLASLLSVVSTAEPIDRQRIDCTELDGTECWMPISSGLENGVDAPTDDKPAIDDLTIHGIVTPAQLLVPQRPRSPQMALRPQRSTIARRNLVLASVPFMIGDTGAGTCLTIAGSNTFAIEHPTLTCSRLNISESNTPLPMDRTYVSYRHFENITGVRVLTNFTRDYNVDRFTLGSERTFLDGMCSLELRLPLERRLTSNFRSFVAIAAPPDIVDPFIGERQNELANVSAILKMLLLERNSWALTAGLGVTVPTAPDFGYEYFFDARFEFDLNPGAPDPDVFRFDTESFQIDITNETVYLSPFLSWLYQPEHKKRFFHQGFLQFEVAANPSRATATGVGSSIFTTPDAVPIPLQEIYYSLPLEGRSTDIFAQTLMRLNLGCGYVLVENSQASVIKRLTGLLELHYTTTLQKPNRTKIPLDVVTNPPAVLPPELINFFDSAFTFGNELDTTNIVNVAIGLSANVGSEGNTVITSGLIMPVSQGLERAFDLEFNLQIQRLY